MMVTHTDEVSLYRFMTENDDLGFVQRISIQVPSGNTYIELLLCDELSDLYTRF
jgi:hypothetical protein